MTIYDIARQAGVSTATVSRVLNHSGSVSEAARLKVEAIIEREGYIPNAFAHSLTTKRSGTVGIICPEIADANHAYPVSELSRLLRGSGFEILLIDTASNTESKRPYFNTMIRRQVEAVIVIGCGCGKAEEEDFRYAAGRVPVFVVNGRIDLKNVYSILCDEEKAACDMVRRFAGMGRHRILYLYDSDTYSGKMKLNGYLEGMRRYAGCEPFSIRLDNGHRSSFYEAARQVRALKEIGDIEAVLTADDSIAVGAAKALREAGLPPVPMIGFNDTILSRCAEPELSSVDIRMKQQCVLTVETLLDVLNGRETASCVKLDAALAERASLTDFMDRDVKNNKEKV